MEAWRQCAHWLVAARVLPAGHRASSPGGQVWDLAQALRDGVLLCHLLNALLPRAVPPHDICPRPQMSQFLCLRNIRTFLTACADKFGLPKHRLFGAFDLFDVQDFGKVIDTLSTLSWTPIAQSKGFTPFPTEDCVGDDDIYSGLSDLIEFLLYGRYCSQECSQRANNGRFSLRDLLMVPMQRVLKYHLLLQPQSLAQFGRPKIDGEMKVSSTERRSKVDRYGFLLDKALIICKRRGDSYEAKDVVDLQSHQLRDGGLGPRDGKKWTHTFLLIDTAGLQGYELFFKTHELKKKWLEQFEMALSNIFPEHALADGHDFQMFSFEDTTSCKACQMLLRGRSSRGYRCSRCRAPAHKECLGRLGTCGRGGADAGSGMRKNKSQRPGPEKKRADLGLPKMEASQPYSGVPPPPGALGPALRLSPGDVVEVTIAEAEQLWWQGRNVANGDLGWFPCAAVRPFICVPLPDLSVYSCFGSAKARYDFCARDRTELTLREGDVIRVLSKKGHPGWWKGEIYGRVGWFPANYVEEDYSEYC
ncbi:proto-oncogene vav [Egretta garzetta]|uniref:proto-oncogene vav n=1 Tax=Egretta garzetta TaxID=188379 RepID=UPI00163C187B|nr:proto-oncogene vav [Egretta garzetta]